MRRSFGLVLLTVCLASCSRSPETTADGTGVTAPTGPSRVLADDPERRWQGVLPCRDCLGIDTRLQLRTLNGQRNFRLQEIYVGRDGGKAFERVGTWTEATRHIGKTDMAVVVLDPDGAAIAIRELPDGTLEWLGPEGEPASDEMQLRLTRQAY